MARQEGCVQDRLVDLAFRARSAITWSAPAWKRVLSLAEVTRRLDGPAYSRAAELGARYDLERWGSFCALGDWRESLYVLDLLDRLGSRELPPGRCLDVGSKNGCYLPGLATAVPRGWDAVELDAHRRYAWGATRRAYGEAMARRFEGCRFIAGDVSVLEGPWALVTWFLPFVSEAPLAAWGLPLRCFAPEALLRHVLDRLVPGGTLLIVNQGQDEAEAQAALFERIGVRATPLGRLDSVLSPFRRERFGWRVIRSSQ